MPAFNSGWYVVYTKSRHERKVHDHLIQQNIGSYLPLTKKFHIRNDRRKYADTPLFPSYVFVFLNNMSEYYEGINSDGALYYVKMGRQVVRVNETIIENIKLASGSLHPAEVSYERFRPGQKMVITEGALAGLSCELVELKDKQRLLVRIDILQRNLLLQLPENHLITDNSINIKQSPS